MNNSVSVVELFITLFTKKGKGVMRNLIHHIVYEA